MEPRSQALRLVVLSALLALGSPAFAEITGTPRVIDGDTIEVAGQRIRLQGIDAPERGQTCDWPDKTIPCGDIAADALTGNRVKAKKSLEGAFQLSPNFPGSEEAKAVLDDL